MRTRVLDLMVPNYSAWRPITESHAHTLLEQAVYLYHINRAGELHEKNPAKVLVARELCSA